MHRSALGRANPEHQEKRPDPSLGRKGRGNPCGGTVTTRVLVKSQNPKEIGVNCFLQSLGRLEDAGGQVRRLSLGPPAETATSTPLSRSRARSSSPSFQ